MRKEAVNAKYIIMVLSVFFFISKQLDFLSISVQ